MSSDLQSTKELTEQYEAQSMSSVTRMNYTPPTGHEDVDHTGGPACYPCCGRKCGASCVLIVAALIVCCAYVSQDGTCCSYCYWPF